MIVPPDSSSSPLLREQLEQIVGSQRVQFKVHNRAGSQEQKQGLPQMHVWKQKSDKIGLCHFKACLVKSRWNPCEKSWTILDCNRVLPRTATKWATANWLMIQVKNVNGKFFKNRRFIRFQPGMGYVIDNFNSNSFYKNYDFLININKATDN